MNVVGMRKFDYTSKRSGESYAAATLFCTEQRKNVVGMACFDLFCHADIVPPELSIGDEVKCLYNRFGGVESIEIVK